MIELELAHDWGCLPLWWNGGGPEFVGPADPEDFPISEALWAEIMRWNDRLEATSDFPDPREWGFRSAHEWQSWDQDGQALWLKLREELGPGYRIEYHTYRHGTRKPEDYPLPQ